MSSSEVTRERTILKYDVEIFGTVPKLGISYVDNKGKTRKFIVYQSGKDGLVQLSREDL